MLLSDLYQATSSEKNNVDYLEQNGPIKCVSNPWLGDGYYFWSKYYEHAEWWGKNHYNGNYYIFKACIDEAKAKVFDLYNDSEEKEYLIEVMENHSFKTVQATIFFLNKHSKTFDYNVIIAHTPGCGAPEEPIHFVSNNKSTFTYKKPAIQVCVNDKSIVKQYFCVYPDDCCQIDFV